MTQPNKKMNSYDKLEKSYECYDCFEVAIFQAAGYHCQKCGRANCLKHYHKCDLLSGKNEPNEQPSDKELIDHISVPCIKDHEKDVECLDGWTAEQDRSMCINCIAEKLADRLQSSLNQVAELRKALKKIEGLNIYDYVIHAIDTAREALNKTPDNGEINESTN